MPMLRGLKKGVSVNVGKYVIACPFYLPDGHITNGDGVSSPLGWVPGFNPDLDSDAQVYNGVGKKIITVVSTHKPGRYPKRIFYRVQWEMPEGYVFGKNRVKVMSEGNFKRYVLRVRRDLREFKAEVIFRNSSGAMTPIVEYRKVRESDGLIWRDPS